MPCGYSADIHLDCAVAHANTSPLILTPSAIPSNTCRAVTPCRCKHPARYQPLTLPHPAPGQRAPLQQTPQPAAPRGGRRRRCRSRPPHAPPGTPAAAFGVDDTSDDTSGRAMLGGKKKGLSLTPTPCTSRHPCSVAPGRTYICRMAKQGGKGLAKGADTCMRAGGQANSSS